MQIYHLILWEKKISQHAYHHILSALHGHACAHQKMQNIDTKHMRVVQYVNQKSHGNVLSCAKKRKLRRVLGLKN